MGKWKLVGESVGRWSVVLIKPPSKLLLSIICFDVCSVRPPQIFHVQATRVSRFLIQCQIYEQSDYSEEITCDNKNFHSIILQPFQFEPEENKTRGN